MTIQLLRAFEVQGQRTTKNKPRRHGKALAAKPARPKNPSIHTVILDSGASESIYTPEVFDKHVNPKSVTASNCAIATATGALMKAKVMGDVILGIDQKPGQSLLSTGVHRVEELTESLLSTARMTDSGYTILMHGDKAAIYKGIDEAAMTCMTEDLQQWHLLDVPKLGGIYPMVLINGVLCTGASVEASGSVDMINVINKALTDQQLALEDGTVFVA